MTIINYCPKCGSKLSNQVKFCPQCGMRLGQNNLSNDKREKVLKGRRTSNKNGMYFGIAAVLFFLVLIFYINSKSTKEDAIINDQPKVIENVSYPKIRLDHPVEIAFSKGGKIILPLKTIKEKKFVKFEFKTNQQVIPLLAYLTEEGKVVTAISLCEPCNSTSFHIIGSDLICNSCGTTWDLNNLKAISGSCGKYPPDPIPSKIVGDEIQIDENIVINWTRRV